MKTKWRAGTYLKVLSVDKGDRFYVCNDAIAEQGGIFVKTVTPPQRLLNGTYWFTGKLLKNYPDIKTQLHSDGLFAGEEAKFDYANIKKLTVAERRRLRR